MNKCYRRIVNVVAIAVLVFAFNIIALAQGTTTITVSKSSLAVGDSVTVSVTGTESGSITVKYTSSMLNYISCSASDASAQGNSVTFSGKTGDIVFKAESEGTASIIVSSTANSGSSTTLTIGDSSSASASSETANQTTTETSTETSTDTTTETEVTTEVADEPEETITEEQPAAAPTAGVVGALNSDGGFDINGVAYVVSERYSNSEMPSGFSKTTIKIGSSTYSEPSNGSITLLYLKPADNTSGSGVFYLYNAEAGTVSEFLMLGSGDSYVIISDNDSAPSSAFTATSLDVTGGTATAYTVSGSEFYYVYGTNQEGALGWFVYDPTYKTISRFDESVLLASSSDTSTDGDNVTANNSDSSVYIEKLGLYRKIIMGLIILCVILLFIIINRAIRGNGDDDFDGDVFAKDPVKSSKKTPRSIVFSMKGRDDDDEDEEYDEYEDDEEYDDYEDDSDVNDIDASRAHYESESYEARRASSLNMMDLNDL